ncbi:MAG: ABC transporter permease [Planctomycetaceae bacterium]|nr:ABC transporter permease [Planctomycetaceae bacterium]
MRALQITLKDLRLLMRDRRAAIVLLLLPLIFITIIGLSTGQILNARDGGDDVSIAVVNLSGLPGLAAEATPDNASAASSSDEPESESRSDARRRNALRDMLAAIGAHDHFVLSEAATHERAREDLDRGAVALVLVVGPEFPEKLAAVELQDILSLRTGKLASGPRSLDLLFETKASLAKIGELAAGVAYSDVLRSIAPIVAGDSSNVFVRNAVRLSEQKARENPPPEFQLLEVVQQKRGTTSMMYETLVPSYTVMFVFFLVNIMARSFIAERDLGTLRRLKLAPISPLGILIGKNIPFYVLSLVQTALLFLGGRLIFGMSWGAEPWLLIPVIVCTSLAATALGLMVSTFIRTDSQVSAYGNSLVIVLAGISGCFMPRKWLPLLMQKISLGTPHAWALMAYDEILSHEHVIGAQIAKSCFALLGFAAVFFLVGWWKFRADAE